MNKLLKKLYHWLTLDFLFPRQYTRNSKGAIQKNKVVFIEANLCTLPNSLQYLYDELDRQGGYILSTHCLGESYYGKIRYISNALKCLQDIATADMVFLCEASRLISCITPRSETFITQLWHGCGAFKRFGLSTAKLKFGGNYQNDEQYPYHKNLNLVTVSSPEVIWAYAEAMNISPESGIIRATGISRTDIYFRSEFKQAAYSRVINALSPKTPKRKLLLWAPTFRGNINNATAPEYPDLFKLQEALADDYLFLIKHHPLVRSRPEIPVAVCDFAFDVSDTCSIEDLICCSDMCISDYSSLVFEYSLMERPMLFFANDKADYEDWRGFYYPYEEMTPGPIVTTTDELIETVKQLEHDFDPCEVIAFKKRFMSACDGQASERILRIIKKFKKKQNESLY